MTPRKTPWSLLAVLVSLALIVGACQAQTPTTGGTTPAPTQGEQVDDAATLIDNLASEPGSIDPHKASFTHEIAVITTVFENLMVLDPKTLKPIPGAAASYESSPDAKSFTFTLRDGLKYSDGAPLTAKDFVYGYTRTCNPETPDKQYSYVLYVIAGCEDWDTTDLTKATPADLAAARDKLGVKALDDKKVQFTLREPAPYFPSIATLWTGMPARESDVTKGGDKWTEPATYIGNGPFKMTEWKHNEYILFEKNPNYRQPVKLAKWKRVMISETAVEFAAYQNNEVDIASVSAENLRAVEADATLKGQMTEVPGDCTFYFGYNVKKPPFDDPKVRMAFSRSYDRQAFVDSVLQGIGKPATGGFIPIGQPGYDETDKIQAFDAAAAKQLITQSKYATASALPAVTFTFSSSALNKLVAEWVQQQWKNNLGVDIKLDPVERTVFVELVKKPETTPQMFYLGWCLDFPHEQNWHSTVWKSGAGVSAARTGYNSPKFDELTGKADTELDPAKAASLYLQAGKQLSEDAPAGWIFYRQSRALIKPWVKGLSISARGVTGLNKHEIFIIKH